MRLSSILSKQCSDEYGQVEGFLNNRTLGCGQPRKISVGKIALNFYCKSCNDVRTFTSDEKLFCIGVNNHLISIDSVLTCSGCDSTVQTWFLVESKGDIAGIAPEVRITKRSERLSKTVLIFDERYDDFSELLEKAQKAYRDGLGAGSIVYLRKILERITIQTADASGISKNKSNGKRKTFKDLLTEVDGKCSIIPKEFSENSYRLFGDLSDVIHGNYDEDLGLQKYDALRRLIVGILDNVKNNKEMMTAIGSLGWNDVGGTADV
jgi:hypothetical protein